MKNELWSTVVGSHMWGMQKSDSDMDIFVCYLAPTKDILVGKNPKSIEDKFKESKIDMTTHELGKVVRMLLVGNVNFVWGVTSPNVASSSPLHKELLFIYKQNAAKNCFFSIDGLFRHNYRDYVEKVDKPKPKRLVMMYRTLQFGQHVLDTGKFEYKSVDFDVDIEMLKSAHEDLKSAYEASDLPEKPDSTPFLEFLVRARILELSDALWH